ncbi:hypothetical protein ACFLSJ_04660 [Verrucomicrobiota bacterium]
MKDDPTGKYVRTGLAILSHIMLGTAVMAVYATLMPSLDHGMLMAGDDCVHTAYSLESHRMITETCRVFDWTYMYGLGAPIYIFRPPGYYLTVQAMYFLAFGLIPLEVVHKLGYVVALSLYPAGVFYMLRKFRFPALACGIGALLAVTPISTWGHTIDAYYDLGLSKQAFAILLFPFCLGKLHGIMAFKERIFPGALMFGLMFLSHPYMGWAFMPVCGLYMLVEFLSEPKWRAWLRGSGKMAMIVFGGMAVVAFWLVPFYSSEEIHPTQDYSKTRRHGFAVITDTTAGVMEHYVRGTLFDRAKSDSDRFGSGSVWAWRNNSRNKRWPVLTIFSMVGLLATLLGYRYRRNAFFALAWVGSMIVFMGPDDIRLLRLIPFQGQFQYVHFVPVPELFTVGLAAFGLYFVPALLWGFIEPHLRRLRLNDGALAIGSCLVICLFSAPFVYNAVHERHEYGRAKTRNRKFETKLNGQTAWSLQTQSNRAFKECTDYLCEHLEPFERFYGSPTKILSGKEIFHFTVAPSYMRRTNLISPLFGGLFGSINNIVHTPEFRRHLWKSAVMMDLFHVGALITSENNVKNYPFDEKVFEKKVVISPWAIYDTDHSSRPMGVTYARPILVAGDVKKWEQACRDWLRQIPEIEAGDLPAYPFTVWERVSRRRQKNPVPLAHFAAVYVADSDLNMDRFFEEGELARFRAAGGTVIYELPERDAAKPDWATVAVKSAGDIRLRDFLSTVSNEDGLGKIEEKRGLHSLEIDAAKPGYVYFKSAFYRGWRVSVDGETVPNTAVSPGFNGCYVGPGKHRIVFSYDCANGARMGNAISLLTVLGFLVPFGVRRVRNARRRREPGGDSRGGEE